MFRIFSFSQKGCFGKHYKDAALTAVFVFGGLFFLWVGSIKMPDFNSFEERKVASSTKIYDRTGKIVLYDVHQNIRRTVIPVLTHYSQSIQIVPHHYIRASSHKVMGITPPTSAISLMAI